MPFKIFLQNTFYVFLIFISACSPGSKESADADSIQNLIQISDGSGPENTELLWRLYPGSRFGGGNPWVVLEPVEFGGKTVYPVGRGDHGTDESRGVPSEPASWIYLSQEENGDIMFHGQPREGKISPALFIPAIVKEGMSWKSGQTIYCEQEEGCTSFSRFEIKVISREIKDTMFGVRPVWVLEVRDNRRWSFEGRAFYPDDNIFNGVTYNLEFIEGRGPRKSFSPNNAELYANKRFAVTALDLPPAPKALSPIHLTETTLPDIKNSLGIGATGYLDPAQFGEVAITAQIQEKLAYGQSFIDLGNGSGASLETWTPYNALECRAPDNAKEEDCLHGVAISINKNADDSRKIVLTATGDSIGSRASANQVNPLVKFMSIFENDKGGFDVLRRHRVGLQRGELNSSLELNTLYDIPIWYTPLDEIYNDEPKHFSFQSRNRFARTNTPSKFGSLVSQPDENGIRTLALGEISTNAASVLQFAYLDDEQNTHFEHTAYPRIGHVNVFSRPGGRDILLSTFGGRIDEVVIAEDGIRLRPIGDVDVPPGEFMVGALKTGDELLITTQADYTGIDSWYIRGYEDCPKCEGVDRSVVPQLGRIRTWRASLPAPAEAVRPDLIWSVEATVTGLDVLVCWAPGFQSPSTEGWTLGGHKPATVLVAGGEDRCVLLVRDAALPDRLNKNSAWTVEGTFPDGKRIAIGMSYEETLNQQDITKAPEWSKAKSPFQTGLWANETFYQSGGVLPSYLPKEIHETLFNEELATGNVNLNVEFSPDLGGNGYWILNMPVKFNNAIGHLDNTGQLTTFDTSTLGTGVSNLSEDGGVLFNKHYLAVDGTISSLPPELVDIGAPLLRFSNDTVCTQSITDMGKLINAMMSCVQHDGSIFNIQAPVHLGLSSNAPLTPIIGQDNAAYFPFIHLGKFSLLRLDAQSLEFKEVDTSNWGLNSDRVDATMAMSWTIDEAGIPLAVISLQEPAFNDHRLVRFTSTGPMAIRRIELQNFSSIKHIRAIKDGDLLLVTPESVADGPQFGPLGSGSPWYSVRPTIVRLPVNDWQDRLTAASDSLDSALSCKERKCPKIKLLSRNDNNDQLDRVTLITDDERIDIPVWEQADCTPSTNNNCSGTSGDSLHWHYADLKPFTQYTVEVGKGDFPNRLRIASGNYGSSFDLSAGGKIVLSPLIELPGPTMAAARVTKIISDPLRQQGLAYSEMATHLIQQGNLATTITNLPVNGVFSPDGEWVLGRYAYHIGRQQFVDLPGNIVGAPVFSLAEYHMAFYGLADGTGIVLRLGDGAIETVASISDDQAKFSGDGQHIVFVEGQVFPSNTSQLVRLNLNNGNRNIIYTGNIRLDDTFISHDGNIAYGYNTTTGDIFIYAENPQNLIFAPYEIITGYIPSVVGFATGQRKPGMLAVVDNGNGVYRILHHDPTAAPGNAFTLVPQVMLEQNYFDTISATDALVVRDGIGKTFAIRTSDGVVLQTFENTYDMWKWPDGRIGILSSVCEKSPGPDCRKLSILSDDAENIEEVITDSGWIRSPRANGTENGYWPFGENRNRAYSVDGIINTDTNDLIFPGHPFDPSVSTLDLPCVPVSIAQPNLNLVYQGWDPGIFFSQYEVNYCAQ